MIRIILFSISVFGIAYLFVPPGQDGVYAVDAKEAQRLLASSSPPDFVFGSQGPTFKTLVGTGQITWAAEKGGAELFRYVATLTEPAKGKTAVRLELRPSEIGGANSVARRLEANPAARNLYVTAFQEHVAATLERRSFNMAHIGAATSVAAVANIGNMRRSVDEVAAAQDERGRLAIKRAYDNEAAGRR